MQPTLRCVLLFVAGVPVSLVSVLVSPRLWTLWVAYIGLMLLLTGLDALFSLPRKRLAIDVAVPATLYVGATDPALVTIRTRAWPRPVLMEVLADLHDDLKAHAPMKALVLPGQTTIAHITLQAKRRGTVTVDRVWFRWLGPFGLTRRQRSELIGKKIAVLPNIREVRSAALRFFSSQELNAGLKVERFVGDGSEFEALREYTPGLDHRAIDWKASARHRKLLVQNFRAERNHQVILAIDTGQLMSEPLEAIPKLDHAVNAGLLVGYMCLRTGDRVGLFGFDAKVQMFVEPGGGIASFHRLQKATAGLAYSHAETNYTLGLAELSLRLRRRSLVIILTDFVDTVTAELMVENVLRLARRHLVVFVTLRDPTIDNIVDRKPTSLSRLHESVIASDIRRERLLVLKRLHRAGVQCLDVPPGQVSGDLLNRYLDIKRRELI